MRNRRCAGNHRLKEVMFKYINQEPEENVSMFESIDNEIFHGTWFYGLWKKSRDIIYIKGEPA